MPRKVILGFGISLDGYIARRNGDLDFLVIDKEGESAKLARSFLQDDLVDELFIGLGPTLLGDGVPGFPPPCPTFCDDGSGTQCLWPGRRGACRI